METSPAVLPWKSIYKIMIGSIIPRPVGWVSTINSEGKPNLAPFSFFNVVCANPPTLLFCPMIRETDDREKDTLRNIRSNGEFVINIVTEELAQSMNITSGEYYPEVDEFQLAGLTPSPSVVVKPPRVAESPIHYECSLKQVVDIGITPGGGSIVIGHVLHIHIDDRLLIGQDKIDIPNLHAIGRLAGNSYCRVNDFFEIMRPPSQIIVHNP